MAVLCLFSTRLFFEMNAELHQDAEDDFAGLRETLPGGNS